MVAASEAQLSDEVLGVGQTKRKAPGTAKGRPLRRGVQRRDDGDTRNKNTRRRGGKGVKRTKTKRDSQTKKQTMAAYRVHTGARKNREEQIGSCADADESHEWSPGGTDANIDSCVGKTDHDLTEETYKAYGSGARGREEGEGGGGGGALKKKK